jgi:hypothetical protein
LALFHRASPDAQQQGNINVVVIHPNDRAAQAAKTIHILIDRFPTCFAVFARFGKPLKVGIFDSLLMATAGSILLDDLIVALASYTGHFGYLFVCSEEAERVDVIGSPVAPSPPSRRSGPRLALICSTAAVKLNSASPNRNQDRDVSHRLRRGRTPSSFWPRSYGACRLLGLRGWNPF